MKQTITKSMFRDAFKACGRDEQFSYEALGQLYDWLEENHTCDEYELDVIELCCDFMESTFDEIKNDYQNRFDKDTTNEQILDELTNETIVIWSNDNCVLFQQF
jgi:hypothetical protein